MKFFLAALLLAALLSVATARPCSSNELAFVNNFYNAVTNCTEDPAKAVLLNSMLDPNMVWKSADNVTFLGGFTFVIYTCYPHVGVNLISRVNIRDSCEITFDDDGFNYYIESRNMLIYNITKDPLNPTRTLNATTFFKEFDSFTVKINPQWTPWNGKSQFIITVIDSYASPRDFYIVEGYLPSWFYLTKKRDTTQVTEQDTSKRATGSLPYYFPYPLPNAIINGSDIPINMTTLLSAY